VAHVTSLEKVTSLKACGPEIRIPGHRFRPNAAELADICELVWTAGANA
jgi:hypothetical protein